ncbi:cardiolipin synthase ClsB [uncultured Ramlibacter sp.]|uniref:cardiolipin synthase ClsB n=1 Tax=uncultured Ramlibacter sp. TaxID=260755 RepID=UPI00262A7B3B|nr:cardiolipin synthase ClsB [uncultured Ramlibacter sp.]
MAQRVPLLRGGHGMELLQGSGEFFPALVQAIDAARREVRLESYIFDFHGASAEVAYALERASRRGLQVCVAVDGFGSDPIPALWRDRFLAAGVQWRVFAHPGRLGMLWPGHWRRLHRKLCVVDSVIGFCGGINILDDLYDPSWGTLAAPRFDFAVRVTGPLVDDLHATMLRVWHRARPERPADHAWLQGVLRPSRGHAPAPVVMPAPPGLARAALVLRDNLRYRNSIERAYRREIGHARKEIIIANAYFVPGHKMRDALIQAAGRGVRVQLLLQGRYEYFMQYYGARLVYGALLRAGVEIHEYSPSFLHAKVAVIDGRWATVGSSNLDPLSFLLAREANVNVEEPQFAQQLRERLLKAMREGGRALDPAAYASRPFTQRLRERLALVLMRAALAVQGYKYL